MNGSGSGRASPSTLTCRSSIASSSAACVLGGVRLISSASSRFVNTGPWRNSNTAVRASYTREPVTSPGIKSGVNCTRLNSRSSAAAIARTSSVLATPGTPSSSTWPRHNSAITSPETTESWPTTALAISDRSAMSLVRASCESGAACCVTIARPAFRCRRVREQGSPGRRPTTAEARKVCAATVLAAWCNARPLRPPLRERRR